MAADCGGSDCGSMRDERRCGRWTALLLCAFACGPLSAGAPVVLDFSAPPASPAPSDRPVRAAALREALSAFAVRRPVVLGEASVRLAVDAPPRRARLVGDRDGSSGAAPWRGLYVLLDAADGGPWAWSLPADAGNAVHGARDLDGDGSDELLLRRDVVRMGVTRSDLVVWSLSGASPRRLHDEPEVLLDTCEAGVGARARRWKQLAFSAGDDGRPLRVAVRTQDAACAGAAGG